LVNALVQLDLEAPIAALERVRHALMVEAVPVLVAVAVLERLRVFNVKLPQVVALIVMAVVSWWDHVLLHHRSVNVLVQMPLQLAYQYIGKVICVRPVV
jgi:hypothetical protein